MYTVPLEYVNPPMHTRTATQSSTTVEIYIGRYPEHVRPRKGRFHFSNKLPHMGNTVVALVKMT